jgi:hypothetical protein
MGGSGGSGGGGGAVQSDIGNACMIDADCVAPAGSVCLTMLGGAGAWTNGYCTHSCTFNGNECPAGAACQFFGAPGDWCLKKCAGNADCRVAEGYSCEVPNPPPLGEQVCFHQ